MSEKKFATTILNWYSHNKRELPWRTTLDPYKIWLSEILLQQTRVQQGLPYYLKFIEKYPSVYDLARASEQDVLKLWQGLGYYSRARNALKAAKEVVQEYDGKFPPTYQGLKSLPGIGDYTASAISSICYNLPEAVVDGNVYRVLARYFGVDIPINSSRGIKYFKTLASTVIDPEQPGEYNQAIMEFGAVCCTPAKPSCQICPLANSCVALKENSVGDLPVKNKNGNVRVRYFNYLVPIDKDGKTFLEQRKGKGIWQNLYQFPLVETKAKVSAEELQKVIATDLPAFNIQTLQEPIPEYKVHKLSHQHLIAKFWLLPLTKKIKGGISLEEAENLPLPVLMADTIKTLKNSYF